MPPRVQPVSVTPPEPGTANALLSSLAASPESGPELRARKMVALALRDAASGSKPLQHVAVLSHRVDQQLVLYEVLVQGANNLRWLVTRRFKEFHALNVALENSVRNVDELPPFPAKEWRVTVDHFSPDFLSQRQALLDNYLRKVLAMPKLRATSSFLEFLRPGRLDLMSCDIPATALYNQPTRGATQGRTDGSNGSSDSPSRAASLMASSSMNDALFEPRSFEDEARNERRTVVASLSAAQEHDSAIEVHSESSRSSRRTSHSQIYDQSNPVFAAPISSSSSSSSSLPPVSAFPSTLFGDVPLWLSPEVSDVSIPAAQILRNDHVVFQINVENVAKLAAFSRWTLLKRHAEFYALDQEIRRQLTATSSPSSTTAADLPRIPLLPKRESKVLVDHLSSRFIEKRRLLLECYLKRIIASPQICSLECVLEFIGAT